MLDSNHYEDAINRWRHQERRDLIMNNFHKALELLSGDLNHERVASVREILEAIQTSSIVNPRGIGAADNCRDSTAVLEQLSSVNYDSIAQAKETLKKVLSRLPKERSE